TKEFLIEVIAPTSNSLSKQDTGSNGIGHGSHAQFISSAGKPNAKCSPTNGTPYGNATFPDGKDLREVTLTVITGPEIHIRHGDEAIKSRTDNAEDYRP